KSLQMTFDCAFVCDTKMLDSPKERPPAPGDGPSPCAYANATDYILGWAKMQGGDGADDDRGVRLKTSNLRYAWSVMKEDKLSSVLFKVLRRHFIVTHANPSLTYATALDGSSHLGISHYSPGRLLFIVFPTATSIPQASGMLQHLVNKLREVERAASASL
ncbi:hypothetical protein KIPB_011267, partial [Kipferlia bialata]